MTKEALKIVQQKKHELEMANKNLDKAKEQRDRADHEFFNSYQDYMNNCTIKELFNTYDNTLFNSVHGHVREVSKAIEFRLEKYGFRRYGPLAFGANVENKSFILQFYRKRHEWTQSLGMSWDEYFSSLDYTGLEKFFTNLFTESGWNDEIHLRGEYLAYENGVTTTSFLERTISSNSLKDELHKMIDDCKILEEKYEKDLAQDELFNMSTV